MKFLIVLKSFFTTHLTHKLIACLITIFAWIAVQLSMDSVTTLHNVPLKFILPENCVVISPLQPTLSVQIRGSESILKLLNANSVYVQINLSSLPLHRQLAMHKISLTPGDVVLPSSCVAVSLTPNEFMVRIDQLVKRERPVHVTAAGAISNEFEIALNALPSMIYVEGPSSYVNSIMSVKTVPIHLDASITESFSINGCNLVPAENAVTYSRTQVDVSALVRRKRIHRSMSVNGVDYLLPPQFPYTIEQVGEVDPIEAHISGEINVVSELKKIQCYVDFTVIKALPASSIVVLPIEMVSDNQYRCEAFQPAVLSFKLTPIKK